MSDTDMVPRHRLNEELARVKELQVDLAKYKADLTAAQTAAAEADTLRATLAKVQGEHDTFRAGVDAGITDPEGLELARYFYDKVAPGEDGTKPAFAEYLSGMKTDPTMRPKALTSYFAEAPQAPAAPTAQATPGAPAAPTAAPAAKAAPPAAAPPPRSAAPLPGANTGATPQATPAPTHAGWTAATVASLTPAEYAVHRADILKSASPALAGIFGSR
jgi:hypothetical protein